MKKMIYAVLSVLLITGMLSCSDDAKEEIGAVDIVISNYRVKSSSRFYDDKESSREEYIYNAENKLVKEESFRFDDNGTIQVSDIDNYSYAGNKVVKVTIYDERIRRKSEATFNNGKMAKVEYYDYSEAEGYTLNETTNITYNGDKLTKIESIYANNPTYTDEYVYSGDKLHTIYYKTNNVIDEEAGLAYKDDKLIEVTFYEIIGEERTQIGSSELNYSGNLLTSSSYVSDDYSDTEEYGYDASGNLVSIQSSDSYSETYTYELGQGNISELQIPSGFDYPAPTKKSTSRRIHKFKNILNSRIH